MLRSRCRRPQDAIKKGFGHRQKDTSQPWSIPYLPIDPADIGMTYEAVIRVNSQSGKGGVAYLVQRSLGLDLPKKMQPAFYQVVQAISERTAKEITGDDIEKAFRATYYYGPEHNGQFTLVDYSFATGADGKKTFTGTIDVNGEHKHIKGDGNGPVSALLDALNDAWPVGSSKQHNLSVKEYSEHALGAGSDVRAASYVQLVDTTTGRAVWGVSSSTDVTEASLKAVLSAASNAAVDAERRYSEIEDAVIGGRV